MLSRYRGFAPNDNRKSPLFGYSAALRKISDRQTIILLEILARKKDWNVGNWWNDLSKLKWFFSFFFFFFSERKISRRERCYFHLQSRTTSLTIRGEKRYLKLVTVICCYISRGNISKQNFCKGGREERGGECYPLENYKRNEKRERDRNGFIIEERKFTWEKSASVKLVKCVLI